MKLKNLQVTVIGAGTCTKRAYDHAEKVGQLLGELQCTVITGGRGGIMEAVCKGAHERGSTTVGILPGTNKDESNPYLNIVIPTGMGHARNVINILAGDLIIAFHGSYGTLSEMSFSGIFQKPLFIVDFGESEPANHIGQELFPKAKIIKSINDLRISIQRYL